MSRAGHDSLGTYFTAVKGPASVRASRVEDINATIDVNGAHKPTVKLAHSNNSRYKIGFSH